MVHRVQSESISAPLYEVRAASTAAGGTALTTTASLITIPKGSDWVSITPRNFATAVVAKLALNPRLTILKTVDSLLSVDSITDISDEAQDGDTTTIDFGSFGTTAAGDYVYVGADVQFRGVAVDVGTANTAANVITVEYWDGATWTDISDTDGTISAAKSLGQDGNITWTVPAVWKKTKLAEAVSSSVRDGLTNGNLYWTRWYWNNANAAGTTVLQIRALNRSTTYMELLSGQSYEQKIVGDGIACVEALTDAGTANLIVNVGAQWNERFV